MNSFRKRIISNLLDLSKTFIKEKVYFIPKTKEISLRGLIDYGSIFIKMNDIKCEFFILLFTPCLRITSRGQITLQNIFLGIS